MPPERPVTTPPDVIVAIEAAPVVHEPPLAVSVNVVDVPWQIVNVPVMVPAKGSGFTLTIMVSNSVPQLLDEV